MSTVTLAKYDAARSALAAARRVDEAKDIRDKAVAIQAYARQVKDHDMIAWATEIKVRAERRFGELLRETAETGERERKAGPSSGRPSTKTSRPESTSLPTLKTLGISRDQSSDFQKLAAIPTPEFEERLKAAARDLKTMTTATLLRPITPPMKADSREAERRVWAGVSIWLMDVEQLPPLATLKTAQPTGGARDALRERLTAARRYLAMLVRLRKERWI